MPFLVGWKRRKLNISLPTTCLCRLKSLLRRILKLTQLLLLFSLIDWLTKRIYCYLSYGSNYRRYGWSLLIIVGPSNLCPVDILWLPILCSKRGFPLEICCCCYLVSIVVLVSYLLLVHLVSIVVLVSYLLLVHCWRCRCQFVTFFFLFYSRRTSPQSTLLCCTCDGVVKTHLIYDTVILLGVKCSIWYILPFDIFHSFSKILQ